MVSPFSTFANTRGYRFNTSPAQASKHSCSRSMERPRRCRACFVARVARSVSTRSIKPQYPKKGEPRKTGKVLGKNAYILTYLHIYIYIYIHTYIHEQVAYNRLKVCIYRYTHVCLQYVHMDVNCLSLKMWYPHVSS